MIPQKRTWTIRQARDLANTLANHSWTHAANSDEASSCIYALCDMLEQPGDPTSTEFEPERPKEIDRIRQQPRAHVPGEN